MIKSRRWIIPALVLLFGTGVGVGLLISRYLLPPDLTAIPIPEARPLVAAFYPEGPSYFDGRLYYVEYSAHRVWTWDGHSATVFWEKPGTGPTAVLPLKNGDILVTCYDNHTVVRLNAKGLVLETIDGAATGEHFQGPNDLAMDAEGGVYISASGDYAKGAPVEGKIFYRSPTGIVSLVADRDLYYPNGLAVTDAGQSLLVAEHLRNRVRKYAIGQAGRLNDQGVWKSLADIQPNPQDANWATGPDGLKVDSQGHVYICQSGAWRILVTGPDGGWLRTIPVPLRYVSNVAFGPDEQSLYVTAIQDAEKKPFLGVVYKIPKR